MKHNPSTLNVLSACVAVSVMLLATVVAADDSALPPVQRAGVVSYRNGGIGFEESTAMMAEAQNYPLVLTFANRIDNRDAYTADVQVSIVNVNGTSVLNVGSAGPLLLIDLPAGKYQVTANDGEHSKSQIVQIAVGTNKRLIFESVEAGQE